MPTILSHPAVPLAIGAGLGSRLVPRPLLAAAIVASILPDIDVYLPLAHRGPTHSLVVAVALGALAALFARSLRAPPLRAFLIVAIAGASHGLLDAFTTGGGAIELFWPFSEERVFMPWQVIEVSPIGISRFFSRRGVYVLISELTWVWPLAAALACTLFLARRTRS